MNASKTKLHFGKVRGKQRLPQGEEREMASKGEVWVGEELFKLVNQTLAMSFMESYLCPTEVRFRLNSLVWVYLELASPRIIKNLHILNALAGLGTINKLAASAQLNTSFVGRLINMTSGGGWTFNQVMRISVALGVDPRVLLFSDLEKVVREQEDVFNTKQK